MSRRHRASGALPTAPGDTKGCSKTPLTSDCSGIWQEKPPSPAPAPSGLDPGTTRSQRQPEGLGPGTAEPCNQPLPSPHSSFLAVTHKLDPNPCSCSTLPSLALPPSLAQGCSEHKSSSQMPGGVLGCRQTSQFLIKKQSSRAPTKPWQAILPPS